VKTKVGNGNREYETNWRHNYAKFPTEHKINTILFWHGKQTLCFLSTRLGILHLRGRKNKTIALVVFSTRYDFGLGLTNSKGQILSHWTEKRRLQKASGDNEMDGTCDNVLNITNQHK